MAEEPIIDLDESRDLPDEPVRSRDGATGRLRLIGFAALAMACVIAFGGGARPPAPALTHLGVIKWPAGALRDGRSPVLAAGLVMAEIGGDVLAYRPDGRPAWRSRPSTDISEGVRSSAIYAWEDSILLVHATLRVDTGGARAAAMLGIALDPATGRERWRTNGIPERVGDLLMVTGDRLDGPRSRAIYRRLPDGLLWTVPPARTVVADAATDALLALTDDGVFTEYQLSTGTPRRTAQLRLPHLAPVEDELSMELFRDRLILRALKISGPELAIQTLSYDRATLRPVEPSPLDRFLSVQECGSVLCASTFERTYILDSDSLAELWRTEPGEFPSWTGGGLILRSGSVRLLDERTGRDRMDIGGWTAVFDSSRSPRYRLEMPTLVTQPADKRTYVARLTGTSILVVGVIAEQLRDCQLHEGFLACSTDHDRTGIWHLRG